MGLPTDILRYFHPDRVTSKILTFGDFLAENNGRVDAVNLNTIIKRLLLEGFLIDRGGDWNSNPKNVGFQTVNFEEDKATYGSYDFLIEGFPLIRSSFAESVFLFEVKLSNDETTVGSGFLLRYENDDYVVTAKHNVIKNVGFKIRTSDNGWLTAEELWITYDGDFELMSDGLIDVAVLKIKPNKISKYKAFELDNWKVLDEILTIGYPPIPGFDATQFAETAAIVALKSTTGEITGEGNSYIGKQDYFLISARVKGGNSGGPVVNKLGKTIGIVADTPSLNDQMDSMGFGIVTPSETLEKVLNSIRGTSTDINVKRLDLNLDSDGWTIIHGKLR